MLFQLILRTQWAIKYAYRRRSAERRLMNGTSLDRRAEELLFGFMPLPPWLCILELRLAALAEGIDLGQTMVFQGGTAEAEAMFPRHVMRWLPDAICGEEASVANDDHTLWTVGVPQVDEARGEFTVSAAAVIFRALVQHTRITPIDGRPPMKCKLPWHRA